jgi:hypothetical protein
MCYYYRFKILPILSNIYNYITRWANRQVSSWAFAISSPGIFIWMLFVTRLLFTICVQMDSYVQSMCYNNLPYLWPSIIYNFWEKWALYFIRETGSHIDTFFVLTPIYLKRDHSNIYSLSVVHVVCGTWSLFTFRAPLPINSLEVITICFGISYCV